jgi:hypothetical protein
MGVAWRSARGTLGWSSLSGLCGRSWCGGLLFVRRWSQRDAILAKSMSPKGYFENCRMLLSADHDVSLCVGKCKRPPLLPSAASSCPLRSSRCDDSGRLINIGMYAGVVLCMAVRVYGLPWPACADIDVLQLFAVVAQSNGVAMAALRSLRSALECLGRVVPGVLTPVHTAFVRLCLLTKSYRLCESVLDRCVRLGHVPCSQRAAFTTCRARHVPCSPRAVLATFCLTRGCAAAGGSCAGC